MAQPDDTPALNREDMDLRSRTFTGREQMTAVAAEAIDNLSYNPGLAIECLIPAIIDPMGARKTIEDVDDDQRFLTVDVALSLLQVAATLYAPGDIAHEMVKVNDTLALIQARGLEE